MKNATMFHSVLLKKVRHHEIPALYAECDEGWGAGFLIESMDSGELAERIIMMSDPGLCWEFGQDARKRMESEFNWRCIVDRYLEVVDAIR